MCTKLCACLCICIESVTLLPTGVVCQNFPREFHRRMRHELSFRSVPLYEPVVIFSLVATVLLVAFFSFQYLPLSGFHKNNGFHPIKGARVAWYRRVHRPFLYSMLLFSLMCRDKGRQTLLVFKHPSNAISIGRALMIISKRGGDGVPIVETLFGCNSCLYKGRETCFVFDARRNITRRDLAM